MIGDDRLKELNKKFGDGETVVSWFSREAEIEPLPSGSLIVDRLTGLGGFPKGLMTEIFGMEGVGKTTLCYSAMRQAQLEGKTAVYVNAEMTFFADWAEAIGVDLSPGKFIQINTTEGDKAFDITAELIRTGECGVVVYDSVPSMRPRQELSGDMTDNFIGLHPRMMNRGIALIKYPAWQTRTPIIFVNQTREKVGVVFGNPEIRPGGRGMKYDMALTLRVSKDGDVKQGTEVVGFDMKIKQVKDKVGAPVRETPSVRVYQKGGISTEYEIVQLGKDLKIIDQRGAWFAYGETRLGHGEEQAIQTLRDNPGLAREIIDKIRTTEG